LLDQVHMRVLALVRERHASKKRVQAHLLVGLEGVITLIGVVNGGGNKLGSLIYPLVALLGDPGEARSSAYLPWCKR
jgi:hypothetical protein